MVQRKSADPGPEKSSHRLNRWIPLDFLSHVLFNEPYDKRLSARDIQKIREDIRLTNYQRFRVFAILFIFIELLWIFVYDLPHYRSGQIMSRTVSLDYLRMHLIIGMVAVVIVILTTVWLKSHKPATGSVHDLVASGLIIIVMLILNISDRIQGYTSTDVSFYFLKMILASVFFLLRSPFNFLAFMVPYAAYLMALWDRRILTESLTHNTIEGTILFLAALVISRQVYEHQVRLMSRTLLLRAANERLEHLSAHDPLTGLVNRSEMTARIASFTSAQAATGRQIGLVLIDLDHFKKINDTYGHAFGDTVLQRVGDILALLSPGPSLAVRWGGEEFLLILAHRQSDDLHELAESLRQHVSELEFAVKPTGADLAEKVQVTASLGITELHQDSADTFDKAFDRADKALYQAKKQGRNQVVAYA